MKKHFWKIAAVVVVIIMGGSIVLAKQMEEKANVGVEIKEHVKGNIDSGVTLVEYSDFQCPACGQFYPIVKDLTEKHAATLKMEYRHFPLTQLHPNAVAAAMAAEAAGQQDKFWEMHDKLFDNQKMWSTTPAPQAQFIKYAEELGLDLTQFKRQMRSSILREHILSQQAEALSKGFTGTPSFLLNDQPFRFETFQEFNGGIEVALGIAPSVEGVNVPPTNSVEFGLPVAE